MELILLFPSHVAERQNKMTSVFHLPVIDIG